MKDFDADNAAPALAPPRKNKWGEEDESDNSIPDNWDDSENETSEDEKPKQAAVPVSKPKTKMSLAEKIAERQAEREAAKKAAVQGGLESDEDDDGLLSTKERDQLRQVEADMQNTDELFAGLTIKDAEMNKTIVNANPKSQEEFDEFQKALAERIQKYQNNRMYVQFLDKFIRELALPLKDVDVRKFVSTLTALANEKQKASRDMNKSKKKSNKKTAVAAAPKNQLDMNDYSNAYDDYDDFM
ncbi:Translation initiation factor 3 subunit J component [Coemansia spiralis]|uniref:Eukaryotic translation initiation factor 3 30 kDa subunit n=1 Tax=Coemansia spiralis TaxID=417178 RepID=A0A9W8GA82_9FUNG|nr:Translation initiation factor 3 subunit J component [Coemansia spiralis]